MVVAIIATARFRNMGSFLLIGPLTRERIAFDDRPDADPGRTMHGPH
jgi:hypothetical protein